MHLRRQVLGILAALAFGAVPAAVIAAEHPCTQLGVNSALGEVWPDQFRDLVRGLAPKPRSTFQKTSEYEQAERQRQQDLSAQYPMFAVVSFAKWEDFSYDADSETLSLNPESPHVVSPCGEGKFCSMSGERLGQRASAPP
jgi:hypothetical protein